jgi:hypothetical protein
MQLIRISKTKRSTWPKIFVRINSIHFCRILGIYKYIQNGSRVVIGALIVRSSNLLSYIFVLRAGQSGSRVRFQAGAGNFSLHHCVQNGSGAHPASYPMGARGSFPGVKRPGREADPSPPFSVEVKECVELHLHSPIRLHGVVLS